MLCLITQVNFPAYNFYWSRRWWDRIQDIFLNLYYFIWQLSGSAVAVVWQLSGGCLAVIQQSFGSRLTVIRHQYVRFVKYCAAYRCETLFSLVFILYEFQGRMGSRSAFKGGNPKIRGFELEQFQKVALICTIRIQLKFENRFMIRLQDM